MSSTIYLSEDLHISYNKIFQLSSLFDNDEEHYLFLSFFYNVDGNIVDQENIGRSRLLDFTECNPSSLRAFIVEKEPIPLDEMVDPLHAEILRERIANTLASLVNDCVGVERLKVLKVEATVGVRLEEEDYAFMELHDAEHILHERRMNSLQMNVYKKLAMGKKDNEICSICLHEMRVGEEVACTPCVHQFHHICISKWFEKSDSCPLCRFKIGPS